MTCASCVSHVSKSLESIPGVHAQVNLATERATIDAPETVEIAALIAAVQDAGYQAVEHGHEHAAVTGMTLQQRFIVAAVLTVPVLLISMIPAWQFDYWQYLMFVLATPVVWWAGWPFHRAAWAALKHRSSSMDTLVSVGTIAAWGWSVWAISFGHAAMVGMRHEWSLIPSNTDPSSNIYFETAAVLITVILLGRWLEERSRRSAGAALDALGRLLPSDVRVLESAQQERLVPLAEVAAGQSIVVLPGERVPVDGVVTEGRSSVDLAMLTGESVPVSVAVGQQLLAGALVLDGRLLLRAEHVGADTRIAQLTALVDQAQVAKSSVQRLADRISAVFVPIVLALALATGVTWWLVSGNIGMAFSIAIAVVIIACPCALGLATPVAIMAGTGRGAQLGIIISGPDAIERSGRIATVFLDKTGTLTTGELALQRLQVLGVTEAEALSLLTGLERGSTHPIAAAVARANAVPTEVGQITVEAGVGVHGIAGNVPVAAVAVHRWNGTLPSTLSPSNSATSVLVLRDGEAIALAEFSDTIKPDARETIAELDRLGVAPVLLSGDRTEVVQAVAAELGISTVLAEQSPEQKLAAIRASQQVAPVAMVGDGINDAAALAAADLGIAIGSGTDLARAASDITLLSTDATAIAQALRLARATRRTIIGNLVWAFGYNVAAIPLAMFGLLGPMIAGAAMAFSSVFVVLNSIRLTRFR